MRIPFALAAAVVLAAAAPQAVKDWRTTAAATPSGSIVVGNPAAKVKLVEYLSFTCPHCGHLVSESKPVMHDAMVRDGTVRVETRAAVRDPFDLAAWSVAKCSGPARFGAVSRAIFAAQEDWTTKGDTYAQANLDTLKGMGQQAQIRAIADNSGLSAIATRAGVAPAALNQCLANPAQTKQLVAMTEAAFAKIKSTPSAEVNGALSDGVSWAMLEPKLRAAGAK